MIKGTRNLTLDPEMRRKAEKLYDLLEGKMTAQELADAADIIKYEVGYIMSCLIQAGRVKRISLNPPNYYPIAYEKCARR